MSANAEMTAMA